MSDRGVLGGRDELVTQCLNAESLHLLCRGSSF